MRASTWLFPLGTLLATASGLTAQVPSAGSAAAPARWVGDLVGRDQGEEGDILSFGVFVHGFDGPSDFTWDFGDGSDPLGGPGRSGVAHEFLRGDSTYTVSVRIDTPDGGSRSLSREVHIRNAAPVIRVLETEGDPRSGEPVQFAAEAIDPGGESLEYEWDFGDGSEPVAGTDLSRPTHTYADQGRYAVTLTVRDEAAETSRTLSLYLGADMVAGLSGAMTDTLAAEQGPAASFAGLLPALSPIPATSVAAVSADMGYCMIYMGFWDDVLKVHVNVLWTPTPEQIFEPGTYVVPDSRSQAPSAGQAQFQFHLLGMDDHYEVGRKQAASGAQNNFSFLGTLGRITKNLFRMSRSSGSGDDWQMYGSGGTMTVEHASEEYIRARFAVNLEGPSLKQQKMLTQAMRGVFTWRPERDDTRTALRMCHEDQPFTIASHHPERNDRDVNFLRPDVRVRFSRAYRPSTVTDQSIQVGFLDEAGEFQPVDGSLVTDDERRTVWFTPSDDLRSLIYYRVRVRGGPEGVLSENGDELPDGRYEWRFGTSPRLAPGARGTR